MNSSAAFESLYKYLYKVRKYDKEKIASYVGITIDEAAYKRITGEKYVSQTA